MGSDGLRWAPLGRNPHDMCQCGCTLQCYICHSAYICNGRFQCDTCKDTRPACGMYSIENSVRGCSQCVDCFKRALIDVEEDDPWPSCTLYEDIVALTLRKLDGRRLEVYSEVVADVEITSDA